MSLRNIVLLNPRYPYGKNQIFLSGSISAIAASLIAAGFQVEVFDLNLTLFAVVREYLKKADLIGISLTGSAYIPEVIKLIPRLRETAPETPIMLGGQVVDKLTPEQFRKLFPQKSILQYRKLDDLANALECEPPPEPFSVPFHPVWESLGEEQMKKYLQNEMGLVISQGCHFPCNFCAADKARREVFRDIRCFEADLRYLLKLAKQLNIHILHFYASNLDFFQNPRMISKYLEVLASIQMEEGVQVRVRCLACLSSFLKACEQIPNISPLLSRAGLWCIGFGVDGSDDIIWRAEHKEHNSRPDLVRCFDLCADMEIRAEVLMVFGFPEDTWVTLARSVVLSILALWRWDNTMLRPYLAKAVVPGNKGWTEMSGVVERLMSQPELFYNLDFAALGSKLTHPWLPHRLSSNAAYLLLCAFTLFGKGCTSPLLPQGGRGVRGRIARAVNEVMPFDR
jgi:hypothetical protein